MADYENGEGNVPSTGLESTQEHAEVSEPINPPKSTNSRVCGVCLKNAAKYKCTRCELPYCSIPCNAEHKANHPADPEVKPLVIEATETSQANGWNPPPPQPGTQAAAGRSDILAPLLASPDLEQLFMNYPSLRAQLREIYTASQPPSEDPSESPNDNRGRYKGRLDKTFWTQEQGTRDGVEALKEAKTRYGKDGEGVREFATLVVNLISPENAVNGNLDKPSPIYRQTQEDNAKMIQQLLSGELGNS